MAIITCTISETTLENDSGHEIESVMATCSKCGQTTESFGTSNESITRSLARMKEMCPNGERNFYVKE